MIDIELLREKGILILAPRSPLEKADFLRVASTVDPFIAEKSKLTGVMIYVRDFPEWEDFAALVEHLRFVWDHQRKVERVAAVSDSGFLKIVPRIMEHFAHPKVKHFDFAEKARALTWLETGK
jgi:hypothetical protein